ncbi:DeoR/GlpR family DNA-binding transcription regulator [Paenibacillus arenilitoris]|uniref:DeoR/GlpR transcriptional regulator n=1 Tax=Paenibacillus arenilitoris TaxID=2772299 RepID=A0A927CRN9_9BACL|nr:DeoR/GlpR family DNA-binding transcription regulator [Paenibacillus arenilitoris]MBD2871912.1 DeoR/GlpR transcriptional regulator [Paenibacillus arenilitoris]
MFANERRMKIMELLEQKTSVTVSELMKRFGVSIETVRRDLEYLESQQALKRVHGGAVSNQKMKRFASLESRMSENRELKRQLAGIAIRYIREDDTIALDTGSTAMELAPLLKEHFRRLTVVTNSPEVFGALTDAEGFELIQIGGQYLRGEKAFYGHMALDAVNRLHVAKAFVFPSAVSLRHGVGVFVHELFDIQRAYIHNADEVFILADSSKFEIAATVKLCDVSPSHTIITDRELPEPIYSLYKKNAIPIVKE